MTDIERMQCDIEANRTREPEGEQIRGELLEWLTKHRIVSVLLDTPDCTVQIDWRPHIHFRGNANLPKHIRPVLTKWGSIYVKAEEER